MDPRYASARLINLKNSLKNLNKLNRNWEQNVLGWVGVSKEAKNTLIKETKIRLLNKFLKTRPLPKNWENIVRRNFSNLNNKTRNYFVKNVKHERFIPFTSYFPVSIPSLRHLALTKFRKRNNQPPYMNISPIIKNFKNVKTGKVTKTNIGSIRIPLSRLNMFWMKPSAKNILMVANEEQHRRLINAARSRQVRLPNNRRVLSQGNKNYLNRIGMINKIYTPSDQKYRRIVSDVFASIYRLLKLRNKPSKRGFFYPPLYFRAPFPGTINRPYRSRYNVTNVVFRELETIDEVEGAIDTYKEIFMNTPVLHVSKARRRRIWETIEDCKGSMASCIKKCNQIYYARNSSPRSVRLF